MKKIHRSTERREEEKRIIKRILVGLNVWLKSCDHKKAERKEFANILTPLQCTSHLLNVMFGIGFDNLLISFFRKLFQHQSTVANGKFFFTFIVNEYPSSLDLFSYPYIEPVSIILLNFNNKSFCLNIRYLTLRIRQL
jgi:hypothetical protein